MDLDKALGIAASAMDAQTTRLRVIAENLANQDTTGSKPGADPYRRKTVTFENRLGSVIAVRFNRRRWQNLTHMIRLRRCARSLPS